MLFPREIMATPSMTKLARALKRGQFRERYDLKRGSSVRMRKPNGDLADDLKRSKSRRTTHYDPDDMLASIKKKEFGHNKSLDQHD